MEIFILIFIYFFMIAPLINKKNKKNSRYNKNMQQYINSKTQNVNLNSESQTNDTSPLVEVNSMYLKDDKTLLDDMIKDEIKNKGENVKKLTTAKMNNKRIFLVLIFAILTFIYVVMYFFNISSNICLVCEGVTFILYLIINSKINIVREISKKAKKDPDVEISNIVAETINDKKIVVVPNIAKLIISVFVAIIIPVISFTKPKILYSRYGEGYAVLKYTRGLTSANTEVVIPDTYKGKDVICIGKGAFAETKVKNVKLPKNLESIKTKAFYNCDSLCSITLPEKVTEIRASAFENCTLLRKVDLNEGLVDIRASAFKNDVCLSEIKLPDSLEYIGAGTFSHCKKLKEITIPEKVTEINGKTFEYCTSLKTINLHDNIVSIHGENFVGDIKLDNVVLPSKITEIKGNTFENCSSLSSIKIPEGVTRIGGHAFYACKNLSNVTVPTTVTEIGSSAFRQCKSLKTIKIPKNAVVDERAFKESPTKISYYQEEY